MLDVCCSRRGLIRGSLATLAAAGLSWPLAENAAAAADPAYDTLHFVSRPDLRPPRIKVTHQRSLPASPRYYLLTTEGAAGQRGSLILDQKGDTVWFNPAVPHGLMKDLNVQEYKGKPVLTWWANTKGLTGEGTGEGVGFIADNRYRVIAQIAAGNGLKTDFHELNLTSRGTALITAFRTQKANLSKVGGSAHGYVLCGVAQEIDIATGKVVFEWNSTDHIPVTETLHHMSGGTMTFPFDYFHINSVAVAHDGDLLIGARNTCAVYKVDRKTGAVKWRLGGKKSSFAMGPGTKFSWQHHVREVSPNVLSLFDDASDPSKEKQSRGILLDLNTKHMRATLRHAYTSPTHPRAANQGSMQVLSGGRVLVGWGSRPSFTEFSASGKVILTGELPPGDWSYRAFTANWTGDPDDRPAAVARRTRGGGAVVYMSWNGATDVARWTVHAGSKKNHLSPSGSGPRNSFETAVYTAHHGPYYSVAALDAHGRVLGRSAVVRC